MVLDRINEMKRQGIPTGQIIKNLKEQGISPKEINESLTQSEIKTEINNPDQIVPNQNINQNNPTGNIFPATPGIDPTNLINQQSIDPNFQNQQNTTLQPSISSPPFQDQPPSPFQTQEIPYQTQSPIQSAPQQSFQNPSQYQEYSQEQPEYEYQEYQNPQSTDFETINDISSQVVEEKTKKFKEAISLVTKFKKESEYKIKEIDKRLSKLETNFEELQMAIIRKIGDYGEDLKNLSKNVKATQDSFAKIIDPLTDNIRDTKTSKNSEKDEKDNVKKSSKSKKRKSTSFEDYLR